MVEETKKEYLVPKPESCGWVEVKGRDVDCEGDVFKIKNWVVSESLEDMKAMVIEKGWSGVTLNKDGHAYFKHVPYLLTKEKTKESKSVTAIHIYEGN